MTRSPDILVSSGGIDSVVLQYHFRKSIRAVIHFDCGQPSFPETSSYLEYHCGRLGHQLLLRPLGIMEEALSAVSPFFTPGYAPEAVKSREEAVYTPRNKRTEQMGYLEGRGLLAYSHAAVIASVSGFSRVLIALQYEPEVWELVESGDSLSPCDTTDGFLRSLQTTLDSCLQRPVMLYAPYLHCRMSKRDIMEVGIREGVDFEKTYSCEFWPRCGRCVQCVLAETTLNDLGICTSWSS